MPANDGRARAAEWLEYNAIRPAVNIQHPFNNAQRHARAVYIFAHVNAVH